MNIGLQRLIEGIVATLRADVIPNVTEAYARGQAVGVIDLLNNIGPRIEWARGTLIEAVSAQIETLEKVGQLIPDAATPASGDDLRLLSTAGLEGERDRLDAEIADLLRRIGSRKTVDERACSEALRILAAHMHDDLTREMKLTRKPLFAEIAKGSG